MKSPFQRIAALALCFTLTLGAFAYRPSEAKAIAGVDDAVVIGALLSAFAGGCGLIFSNNGMTSSELAQGLTDKWNEFKAAVLETDSTFAGWLGYEDMDALLQAIVLSGGNALTVPNLVARKFADFTTWLKDNFSVSEGQAVLADGGYSLRLANGNLITLAASNSTPADSVPSGTAFSIDETYTFFGGNVLRFVDNCFVFCGFSSGSVQRWQAHESVPYGTYFLAFKDFDDGYGDVLCAVYWYWNRGWTYFSIGDTRGYLTRDYLNNASLLRANKLTYAVPDSVQIPDIADDDTAPSPTISGVGDGTATTVEGLLQQILAQLQANTLAPTLDVAGTETGGNTGTDEDAKPYLPYIPQIFEKIKELPGTLANIWESIKGIPAAIAEKIGAFFTTLWGWLQNIIDAITALPAAIAEKIGALFKPDEALVTEIVDAFKGKFGFLSTLNSFVNDLFSLTPESDPPVIWVHLENAESKYGYSYGDKQKIFDMTWYQKYKASVDGLLSGFLWLGYLWLLFKRAPAILGGMQLSADDAPRSADMPDVLSSPRLGAGDGSTMYRGDGFTMRDKGGRSK